MAERRRPLKSSGGKVMGTRRMVLGMELSPRIFQKDSLLRRISIMGGESGMRRRPRRRMRCAGFTFEGASSGA